jgi:vacuolar-type H+-ATPase subunit I/STV1
MMATGTTNPGSDALTGLRQLLRRLECRQMSVKQGGIDVTSQQISLLRREIAQLERILSRLSGKG